MAEKRLKKGCFVDCVYPSLSSRWVVAVPSVLSDLPGTVGLSLIDVNTFEGFRDRLATSFGSQRPVPREVLECPITGYDDVRGGVNTLNSKLIQ